MKKEALNMKSFVIKVAKYKQSSILTATKNHCIVLNAKKEEKQMMTQLYLKIF
jgi:hypothetical protein